jgi:hypothetical protein
MKKIIIEMPKKGNQTVGKSTRPIQKNNGVQKQITKTKQFNLIIRKMKNCKL